jgi:hypothetical protein
LIGLIGLIGLIRQERSDANFQLLTSNFQILIMIDSIGRLIGLGDWHFAELSVQTPSAIKNSSGTSCRSTASLRSAFKRLRRSRIPGVNI